MKRFFEEIDSFSLFEEEQNADIDFAKTIIDSNVHEMLKNDIEHVPKLRTYHIFKNEYNTEPYVIYFE